MKQKIKYIEVIKESASLAWKNKRLFIFGLIITITSGGANFEFNDNDFQDSVFAQKIMSLGTETLLLIFLAFLALVMLLILAHVFSKIALIKSVVKLLNNESFSVKQEFKDARQNFLRIVGINVLAMAVAFLLLLIIAAPIFFISFSATSTPLIIILSIAAFLIFIPAAFLVFFIGFFGQIYIIKHKLSIQESVKNSYNLLNSNIASSVIMAICLIIFNLAFSIIGAIILVPLIVSSAFASTTTSYIVAGTISLIVLIPISTFVTTVQYSAWVKFFTLISQVDKKEPEAILESDKKEIESTASLEALKSSQANED
ncbi:hypothetical protein ACFL2R_03770 [Patescibacteria group bacterium]